MDSLVQHLQAVLKLDVPEGFAPLRECVTTPHVVDQNVESLVPPLDRGDQFFHFGRLGVIHTHSNATPAGRPDECCGIFDGFGPTGGCGSAHPASAHAVKTLTRPPPPSNQPSAHPARGPPA